MSFRSISALASVCVASSLFFLAGCGGKSIGDDLMTNPDPTDPTDPKDPDPVDPRRCAAIAPACDPGDQQVASDKSCSGADYCYSRTEPCSNSVLWCAHYSAQCTAMPSCNAGDVQVSDCPSGGPGGGGVTCYPRTMCGSTITCMHRDACKALPACDAGDKEVVDIGTCQQPGASCYSRTECNFTIWCNDISN